jgi:type I restriction enzyme R subunit
MADKEATARIKINKLLEEAGWRFFPSGNAPANICLEPSVKVKSTDLDALGDNFEKISMGSRSSRSAGPPCVVGKPH